MPYLSQLVFSQHELLVVTFFTRYVVSSAFRVCFSLLKIHRCAEIPEMHSKMKVELAGKF